MREALIGRLIDRINAFGDLIPQISAQEMDVILDVPKDKSISQHLWCVVGARESYARAISVGEWQGFSCSLQSLGIADFEQALQSSGDALVAAIHAVEDWNERRDQLLLAVAEHEVMHEGQLIRHVYGMGKRAAGFMGLGVVAASSTPVANREARHDLPRRMEYFHTPVSVYVRGKRNEV